MEITKIAHAKQAALGSQVCIKGKLSKEPKPKNLQYNNQYVSVNDGTGYLGCQVKDAPDLHLGDEICVKGELSYFDTKDGKRIIKLDPCVLAEPPAQGIQGDKKEYYQPRKHPEEALCIVQQVATKLAVKWMIAAGLTSTNTPDANKFITEKVKFLTGLMYVGFEVPEFETKDPMKNADQARDALGREFDRLKNESTKETTEQDDIPF